MNVSVNSWWNVRVDIEPHPVPSESLSVVLTVLNPDSHDYIGLHHMSRLAIHRLARDLSRQAERFPLSNADLEELLAQDDEENDE